ncbi:MAG: uracil-DNA glycosylase family protein [Candidatus Gastranaerophilaceae bacterium]|nr:uracil-DNA glycosylase family protein [Candidatus Gastranaerophilaceae bacterium]
MTEICKMDIENSFNKLKESGWLDDNFNTTVLVNFIMELDDNNIRPAKEDIFNAFKIGKPEDIRVLIIGQDPYPDKEKAHGYAFSVKAPKKRAASLTKIFNAIDIYCKKTNKSINSNHSYNLEQWANKSKVLLLNSALTYEKSKCFEGKYKYKKELNEDDLKKLEKAQQELQKTHMEMWEPFTINIMENLFNKNKNVVVFLWGDKAKRLFNKCNYKENIKNYASCHPRKRYKGENDKFKKEVSSHFTDSSLDDVWQDL